VAESVKLALPREFVPDGRQCGAVSSARKWRRGSIWSASSACSSVCCLASARIVVGPGDGELASEEVEVGGLGFSALVGCSPAASKDPVTFVNAPALAAERACGRHQHGQPEKSQSPAAWSTVRGVYSDGSVTSVAGAAYRGPQQFEKIRPDQRPQLRLLRPMGSI